jgi:hypothetical protein
MIPIPARYEGIQEFKGFSRFALWTIWEAIPGHTKGSTLSDATLRAEGYQPINTPEAP